MLEDFKQLPIWKQFDKTNKSNYNIDELANSALSLMDLYYTAFPKYTLHNRVHQKNILKIIGELLGTSGIKNLSCLECAIIILSVFYHDIGMVFKDEELNKIQKEKYFKPFLKENIKARLIYNENSESITPSLAEWYCRWVHAKRVWLYLGKLDAQTWGKVSLKNAIGNICESHNEDANVLIDDAKFDTDFNGEADLRFCAVLLRIGDILDFDNSRTPKSVYEFLDLDNPKNASEKISNDEWQKHLCSDGFKITHPKKRVTLKFIASPNHPQIEKNITSFLDIIDNELEKCRNIIQKCSEKWREFELPLRVDRKGIQSNNYKKGDYKLSLDENKIIQLLVGEGLYGNGFVFLRELLQNAIDTSRWREYYEHCKGNLDFRAKPIEVSTWIDIQGSRWVGIDDYGMGIDEYVLTNHLLKKGNSFYNSDLFKLQKIELKEKTKQDFTPISRFGIGLLSCFILGDTIELNTKSINSNDRIRLSIEGLQGQYIVQTEKENHVPNSMPTENSFESGFREDVGTSIAVRIDRVKDEIGFEENIEIALGHFVSCSSIEIRFKNKALGFPISLLNKPFAEYKFLPFSDKEKNEIEQVIKTTLDSEIGIEIIPINVTETSKTENLRGQFVFLRVKCDSFIEYQNFRITFDLFSTLKKVKFQKSHVIQGSNKTDDIEFSIDITKLIEENIHLPSKTNWIQRDSFGSIPFWLSGQIRLIHNGIDIPNINNSQNNFFNNSKIYFDHSLFSYGLSNPDGRGYGCYGLLYFQDNMLPDLAISRNSINSLSFSIYSHLFFATKELNSFIANRPNKQLEFNYFEDIEGGFTFNDVKNDECVVSGYWNDEKIIWTKGFGILSINELRANFSNQIIRISSFSSNEFMSTLTKGLIEINFEVEYQVGDKRDYQFPFIIKGIKNGDLPNKNIDKLSPLLFVPFSNESILADFKYINERHPLVKWILINQELLLEKYYGYFRSLIGLILSFRVGGINDIIKHFQKVLPLECRPQIQEVSKSNFIMIATDDNF